MQRTSQSHLETEESLGPIPLAIQLQESKRCLDGSFSSGSSRSNLLAIDTGDQKEAGEEYSKGSFHTPFPTANPYKNQEHALRTLYTQFQFAFVLHSFCALVNHILHMCKMCVTSKILGTCAKCAQEVYIAICVQFAHNPQDMCTICAVCAHNLKKKKKKKFSTSCWSPVQALGRPNVRVPVFSMWYGLRHLQLFKKTFYMCSYTA